MPRLLHKIIITESETGVSIETFRKLEIMDEWIPIGKEGNPSILAPIGRILLNARAELRHKIKPKKED